MLKPMRLSNYLDLEALRMGGKQIEALGRAGFGGNSVSRVFVICFDVMMLPGMAMPMGAAHSVGGRRVSWRSAATRTARSRLTRRSAATRTARSRLTRRSAAARFGAGGTGIGGCKGLSAVGEFFVVALVGFWWLGLLGELIWYGTIETGS